jgi:hypothetical protein
MKRWVALAAVFCTVAMAASGVLAPCWADTFISFTDTNPNSWSLQGAFSGGSLDFYASWTQTVATTNTSIGAIVGDYSSTGSGTAWLTNKVGTGTTAANVIDTATFTIPVITDSQINNLNTAPMTGLFSGISLDPGTYYLVLGSANGNAWWGGLTDPNNIKSDALITTAPGFTEELIGSSYLPGSFPPSADWLVGLSIQHFAFSVEGTAVPLPPTVWLLGSSLLGLAGWRRFRKS